MKLNIAKFDRLKRDKFFSAFTLLIQLSIGYVFLWGSIPKIRQPYNFLSNIYEYELLGPKLGMLLTMTLPWLELLVGICLVGGIFVGGALLISVGMAAMFAFALSSVLYRGLEISCGCFGATEELITLPTVMRACMILLFSLIAYLIIILQFHRERNVIESN